MSEAASSLPGLPTNPPAVEEETASVAETPAETPTKEEKKPTEYVILVAEVEEGPFTVVGKFSGFGQTAAKKLAGAELVTKNVDVSKLFFAAVPTGSWTPEKPTVKNEPTISF